MSSCRGFGGGILVSVVRVHTSKINGQTGNKNKIVESVALSTFLALGNRSVCKNAEICKLKPCLPMQPNFQTGLQQYFKEASCKVANKLVCKLADKLVSKLAGKLVCKLAASLLCCFCKHNTS